MSRQKAKPAKGAAKLPKRSAWVKLHIPSLENEDISWCGGVRMTWMHLIAFPRKGDSLSELETLRVCHNCLRWSAWYFKFTD